MRHDWLVSDDVKQVLSIINLYPPEFKVAVTLQLAATYQYKFWGHIRPCGAAVNSYIYDKYRNE